MFQDLIDFIEQSSIEDVRKMLKDNGVKFKSDLSKKYDDIIINVNKNLQCYDAMNTNVTVTLNENSQTNKKNIYKKFKTYENDIIPMIVNTNKDYSQNSVIYISEGRVNAS